MIIFLILNFVWVEKSHILKYLLMTVTLAIPLGVVRKLACSQFPETASNKLNNVIVLLLSIIRLVLDIVIYRDRHASEFMVHFHSGVDAAHWAALQWLAPCCTSFIRFLIAPTNFQAQLSCCQIRQCCSEPTGLYWFREY